MTPKQLISSAARRAARQFLVAFRYALDGKPSGYSDRTELERFTQVVEREFAWVEGLIETATRASRFIGKDTLVYPAETLGRKVFDELAAALAAIPGGENE